MHVLPGLVAVLAVAISTNQVVCFVLDSSPNGNNYTDCKDKSEECLLLNSTINLCADVDRAKVVCGRFCNLCPIDGGWSSWGNWSQCDVTCGNGMKTKARLCNNPVPENGGNSCSGENQEVKFCTLDPCPVRGGWSMWSPWGECSATCDVGIERRDRSCSNPYPDKTGDHCFGDSRDDRICMSHPCTDGGWSSWQQWEACSVTCGGGLKRRHRLCDNPAPSAFGRMCAGTDEHTEICNNFGCKGSTIAFQANHVKQFFSDVRAIFDTFPINDGNNYDINTGFFTAPVAGLYSFTANLCSKPSTDFNFGITKGSNDGNFQWLTGVYGDEHGNTKDYVCTFTSALTRLETNEKVAVRLYSSAYASSHYQASTLISTFTGTKLAA